MTARQSREFVEIFCGIGGLAYATREWASIYAAIDINRNALEIYRLNFPHPVICKTIESLSPVDTEDWADKSWWMSPPCQPYTRRGQQRDMDDPRSQAFLNVLELIKVHRPPAIALENVPEFAGSQGHRRLVGLLKQLGYFSSEVVLCPTQFGFCNRRRRFYLIAAKTPLRNWQPVMRAEREPFQLESQPVDPQLDVAPLIRSNFANSLDLVAHGQTTPTACFTSAYGRSHVRSGSYLLTQKGLRRFSPREILWQLGFGNDYLLPDWPCAKLWPLVGNSLSIPAVRYVISHLRN
jgi:DNA (cytosine-5)-methyltransferase 1/tRNA (cytosine38-C5)-methyltransferase